jgi:hypothetical protein
MSASGHTVAAGEVEQLDAAGFEPTGSTQRRETSMADATPNLYQVQGHGIHVTYSTTGFDAKPHFDYQDANQTLHFEGDQIRSTDSEFGTLVTVTTRPTVDAGTTTFTLVVPQVNLGSLVSAPITTFGITTQHRFSIVPKFNHGQTELYTVVALRGTASAVAF